MLKRTVLSLMALGILAATALAADVKSGLKPGESVGAFQVVDVTGPNKGKQLCYRCSYGASPVVAAFIKPDAPEAAGLVNAIQKLTDENGSKGLRTFVVIMGGPDAKASIEKMTGGKITIPVTFLPEGPKADDIASYQINPQATNTIMLWNKSSVRSTFTNVTKEKWADVAKAAQGMLK